jgi:hypothetical protein
MEQMMNALQAANHDARTCWKYVLAVDDCMDEKAEVMRNTINRSSSIWHLNRFLDHEKKQRKTGGRKWK